MENNKIKTINVIDFNAIPNHIVWINENRVNKHNYKLFPIKIVNIDFSKSKFLKPYHIAPLACLIKEYQDVGFSIKLINIPLHIQSYLDSFQFNQFCIKEYKNDFSNSTDPKTLSLWKIQEESTSIYPYYAQKYFENNLFDGKSLFSLSISLAELMNNIFDHSGSKIPGFTFSQYNTRNNKIINCVCDFGIGIPKKINIFLEKNGLPKLDNISALEKAFEKEFSTKSRPHNRGWGWDTIISNIKSLNSKLLIITNNVIYCYLSNGEIKTTQLKVYFPGTLIVITLNTNNLPLKEEELTDELIII